MSTIQINRQHLGHLNAADITNIKNKAEDGDTVKFGSVFGKEYSVIKNGDGEISLKTKENCHFFRNFFSKAGLAETRDLKLNLMNQQLHKKDEIKDIKVLTITYNQANHKMSEESKNYFQDLMQNGDYDVVLFAEQESKLLANDLKINNMKMLSQNKMKVMTKGLSEGVSYTSMSVFAKDGVDINVKNESVYRHGAFGMNMPFFMGLTGNKGGVKTALEINGQALTVISAHLDSNKEDKRALEGNKLMAGIRDNEEVLITGDLNEREKRITKGSDVMYDPIANNKTHLAKHGFNFKPLNSHTYMQLDEHAHHIKQKKGRDRPDFGELDNTGLTNKTERLLNHKTRVITEGFYNNSDHKPVQSTFEVKHLAQKFIDSAMKKNSVDFKDVAKFLKTGIDVANASISDIKSNNEHRLGFEKLTQDELGVIKNNFPRFITSKDDLFDQLSDHHITEMKKYRTEKEKNHSPKSDVEKLGALSKKLEIQNAIINDTFNKQFVEQFVESTRL